MRPRENATESELHFETGDNNTNDDSDDDDDDNNKHNNNNNKHSNNDNNNSPTQSRTVAAPLPVRTSRNRDIKMKNESLALSEIPSDLNNNNENNNKNNSNNNNNNSSFKLRRG